MDPIKSDLYEKMNGLAKELSIFFKPYGFSLLVFDFQSKGEGRMNYISNAKRDDMLAAMKEFIAKHEGRLADSTQTKQ